MNEEIKSKITYLESQLETLKNLLQIEQKRINIQKLQEKMSEQNFWQNQSEAFAIAEELKKNKNDVDDWEVLLKKLEELKEFVALEDEYYESQIRKEIDQIIQEVEQLKIRTLFVERYDYAAAIVEINAGAGGTEACDWANMLFRMYVRWAEDKTFLVKIINELKAEEAGIKNITFLIEGRYAYGLLKSERGVHRLVRISPFDANKRRHTSFASVDVIPQIKDDIEIEINPQDLKIETFRASGKGGQHVNRTDSAVRITHLPTGITVSCQNERSQHQNKQMALSILKAKLYELKEEEKKRNLQQLSGIKQKIEWGSQIRSYILYPYLLVKDHRTNFSTYDAKAVLDGKLDDFIYAYLKKSVSALNV
ncbi:MAG: peptide chain release factor 2 [Candidatus Omnitrophica bacterium]|nr:peptide chain release factor 2 [Candidatus Omnitrophota bacterium]